jgi:AraC-like DNA-binding protein
MDVLSDVLRVVRLSGALFFTAELSAPWALESPDRALLAAVLPNAECLALFHVLVEGECWVETGGHPTVHLHTGDVIIYPHSHPHIMRSAIGVRSVPINKVLPADSGDELSQLNYGGGGNKSRFLCGYLGCDQRFAPLIGALPTMILVRSRNGSTSVEAVRHGGKKPADVRQSAGAWLNTTLNYTIHEAASFRPGNAAMLGRLTEIMFLNIVREYMQHLPPGETGWLAGLQDPQVGKALRLMHADPARRWTVEQIAREVGTSRSALAELFTELLDEAPMHYLARWRIHLARQLLCEPARSIPDIAAKVGYESEAAFNRAFKRLVGTPPAAWRRAVAKGPQPQTIVRSRAATAKRAATR